MVQINFDARTVQPSSIFAGQLPVSDQNGHRVIISASEGKPTKDGNGGFLELTLKIIEGPYTGETGPYRLNLWNASEQAKEIAHKQLSAVCHATGVFMVADTSMLHNIPFRVIVGPQKDSQYTEVKGVKSDAGVDPGKNAGTPAPQPAPAPAFAPQPAPAPAPANGGWSAPPPAAAPAPATQPWAPTPANAPPATAPWSR